MSSKVTITPEMHSKIFELYQNNTPITAIVRELGLSYPSTYKYIRDNPDVFKSRKEFHSISAETLEKMISFWNAGHSANEMAAHFNISLKKVYEIIEKYPYKFSQKIKITSPQLKILVDNHDRVIEMWNCGTRVDDIAKYFNVSSSVLYKYIRQNPESFVKRSLITPTMQKELISLWNSGFSIKDITSKLHISYKALYRHISLFPNLFPKRENYSQVLQDNTVITPEVLEEIAEMWKQGISVKNISKKIGVSTQSIYRHIKRHPEKFPKRVAFSQEEHNKLLEFWRKNIPVKQIAEELNKSVNTINRYINHHRSDFPKKKTCINSQTENEIIALWNSGVKGKDIAAKLGCSPSNVFIFVNHDPRCTRRGKAGINRKLFVELWNNGTSVAEIAKHFSIKTTTVYVYSKKYSECISRNTENSNKKERFVELWNKGLSKIEIAEILGIKPSTVTCYARRYPGCISRK